MIVRELFYTVYLYLNIFFQSNSSNDGNGGGGPAAPLLNSLSSTASNGGPPQAAISAAPTAAPSKTTADYTKKATATTTTTAAAAAAGKSSVITKLLCKGRDSLNGAGSFKAAAKKANGKQQLQKAGKSGEPRRLQGEGCPTDPFTTMELWNLDIDVFELHEVYWWRILKIMKGTAGWCYFLENKLDIM